MNGPRSRLMGVPPGQTALAVFVALGVAGVLPSGEAAEQGGVISAVRRVQVHRFWCEPGMESDPGAGLSLRAHVEAVGLKWQSLLVEIRLRTPDGKPVQAIKPSPEGYADAQGRFFMWARLPAFDDRFEWPALRASIPYEKVFDLPAERPQRLIATFRASCEGLASVSEAEITLAPSEPPRMTKSLAVLAIDPFANSRPPDETAAEEASRDDGSRGLMVEGHVEAKGLGRSKLVGKLMLQSEEGKPLLHKDLKTKAERPVEHSVQSQIVADQVQILPHFLPYDALELAPGRHRLIVAYTAQCDGLTASVEEEHVVEVPGRRE